MQDALLDESRFEAVVAGAGAVGLAAALGFARAGFATCLVGPHGSRRDGRTAALLDSSLALMSGLGLAAALEPVSAPLRVMRIVDDTDSLFRPPPATFRASEIGLDAFGRNVENATLLDLLAKAASGEPNLVWLDGLAAGLDGVEHDRVRLADGSAVHGKLIVAADGRRSRLREAAGLAVRSWEYPQAALTTLLAHTGEHHDVSTEFHTRGGPFTLVPLPGRHSSLVWVTSPRHASRLSELDDAALAQSIEGQSRALLGRVTIDGPRGIVPLGGATADRLTSGRVALVGEAAHVLPPIGAQGLNIGLKDVAALLAEAERARSAGQDIGSEATLAAYARARAGDIRVRTAAVDGLNRALLSGFIGLDAVRGFGLGALARIGPVRRAVMRAGLMSDGPRRKHA